MSPRELEGKYLAALSTIAGESDARHSPIFRREPATTEKQAISDAATALAALWKIGDPKKR